MAPVREHQSHPDDCNPPISKSETHVPIRRQESTIVENDTPDVLDFVQHRAVREQRHVHRSLDAIEAAVDDLDDDPFYEDEEKAIEALLKLIRKSRDRAADASRSLRIAGDD